MELEMDREARSLVNGARKLVKKLNKLQVETNKLNVDGKELKMKICAYALQFCHKGKRTTRGIETYTMGDFCKEIGVNRNTIQVWINSYGIKDVIVKEKPDEKPDLAAIERTRKKVGASKDKDLIVKTYEQERKKDKSDTQLENLINKLKGIQFLIVSNLVLPEIDQKLLLTIHEIVKIINSKLNNHFRPVKKPVTTEEVPHAVQ